MRSIKKTLISIKNRHNFYKKIDYHFNRHLGGISWIKKRL